VNGGCHENNAKYFFDRKKLATTVASPYKNPEIKASCCTAYSSARCSDWAGVYGCATGTTLQKNNAAAPDGANGKQFSALAKFREKCCTATPKTCANWSGLWIVAQAVNGGCHENNAKYFFDRKKLATTVASPYKTPEIKAACCTAYSSARCSDWVGVYGCATGTVLQQDNAAAPDGTNGKSFSALAKFREKCCATPPTPPKKCSDYSVAWIVAQAANGGCHENGNKAFFDRKKLAMTVASPQGKAEITSACCTAYSSAKCSDWAGVYGCASGTVIQPADAAAPDGSDGKTFSALAKFRQVCCKAPMRCSAYTGTQTSGAIMHVASLWVAVIAVIAIWVL